MRCPCVPESCRRDKHHAVTKNKEGGDAEGPVDGPEARHRERRHHRTVGVREEEIVNVED